MKNTRKIKNKTEDWENIEVNIAPGLTPSQREAKKALRNEIEARSR